MEPTLTIDTRQFNQALQLAAQLSGKSAVVALNTRAYAIAAEAAMATEKASRERIEHQMGAEPVIVERTIKRGKNKGQTKTTRRLVFKDDSLGARIILKRIRDAGAIDFMPAPEQLLRLLRRMIAARKAAVGFITSGFVRAARDLRPFSRLIKRETPAGVKVIGKKGAGIPAREQASGAPSDRLSASIINDALIAAGGRFQAPGSHDPMPVAERGLRAGIAKEWAELRNHLLTHYADELKRRGFVVE